MFKTAYRILTMAMVFSFAAYSAGAAEESFFDSDGVKIRYIEEGEGVPVILVHGYTASAEANWVNPGIFKALADDYRVIALDNRGHGKSDKPHDVESYGKHMPEDVLRLMDHLGIEKAHVVGYSMGGFMTTYLLAHHPDRLLSAVPSGAGWNDPTAPSLDTLNALAESLENGNGIGPLIDALTPAGEPKVSDEQKKMFTQMLLATNDPLALAAVARGMVGFEVSKEALAASPVPVLTIIGEVDPLKASTDALIAARPATKELVIPGANHMNAFMNPKFVEGLEAFLAEHSVSESVLVTN